MRRRQTMVIAAAVLAATVGLGAQSSSPARADVNELDQYHLTIETLHKVDLATIAIAKNMETDAVVKNWQDAKRETEALQTKDDLTTADERRLEQLKAVIESKPYDREGTPETISAMSVAFAPGVNAQNVKIVADHQADIERIGHLIKSDTLDDR